MEKNNNGNDIAPRFVFDLDGVIRDLSGELVKNGVPSPRKWDWKHKGLDIFGIMKKTRYKMLLSSKKTEYFDTILEIFNKGKLEIWSAQPEEWKKATIKWLDKHLPGRYKILFLEGHEKEEYLYRKKNIYLIEDSPNFENYSKIILISRRYNHWVKAKHRVKTPLELKKLIKKLRGKK